MIQRNSVMLVGSTGSMARYLLGMLAKDPSIKEIYCVARNVEQARKDANIHMIGAHIAGLYPNIHVLECDVTNVEQLAELIAFCQPDVVMNCTRAVSGTKYGPTSIKHLDDAYGGWTVFALPLSYAVAKAVQLSGITTRLINSSYSDVVCPALDMINDCQTPWSGIGNVGHLVPRLRLSASQKYDVAPEDLDVRLIASHYLGTVVSRKGHANGSPYLAAVIDTKNNSIPVEATQFDMEELWEGCNIPVAEGPDRNVMSASSCFRTIKEALQGSGKVFHAPGPNVDGISFVGGYPVKVVDDKLELALEGYPEFDAVDINRKSLEFDGIASIGTNGIFFTEKFSADFKSFTGMDYTSIPLDPLAWPEIQNEIMAKIDFSANMAPKK